TYQYGVRSMVERLVESGLYIRLRFRMVCRCLILEPPKSTLFPYTTLFRSRLWQDLSQDFDLNLFYSTRGHFTLAHTDAAMRTMRWRAEVNKHFGIASDAVDSQAVRAALPMMDMSCGGHAPLVGALYHAPGA